jgi:pimeloyl-ACP methyl ester carboxylesterase
VLDRLSDQRRCIAPDFLALGYTEVASQQNVRPEDQLAMLGSFLDALSIRGVDLVASDSGGAVAQLFIARYPDRVRSVLLANCDSEIESPPPALAPVIELSKAGKFVDEWLATWRADKVLARSSKGIGGMCYANATNPTDDAIEYYFATLMSAPERKALVHRYAMALERNALEGIATMLRRSKAQARIVWGTADTIFSAAGADHLHRSFANSRGVRFLEGSKLFWPEELPNVVVEEARLLWE